VKEKQHMELSVGAIQYLWRQRLNMEQKREQQKEKDKAFLRKYRLRLRMEILLLLGNKCSNPNCLVPNGCMDSRCLQIDHVNGGGAKEIRKFHCGASFYLRVIDKIKSGSKDYQLLCANCNWIKRVENGEIRT